MKVLITEKLSDHKFKTPEGYLICVDAILARTGKQQYRRSELWGDSVENADELIDVDRPEDEVFSDKTLASFENKPITVEHPDEDVNSENYKAYTVGFVRDVKRGKTADGQNVMLGTLVIQDSQTIREIEEGEHTDLSCGYDCDIQDEANPKQINIRGNHVALCQEGRAGIARIVDSKIKDDTKSETKQLEKRLKELDKEYNSTIDLAQSRRDPHALDFCNHLTKEEKRKLERIEKEMYEVAKRWNQLRKSMHDDNMFYGGIKESDLRKSKDFKVKEYLKELDDYRNDKNPKKEFYIRNARDIINDINKRLKQIEHVPNDVFDSKMNDEKAIKLIKMFKAARTIDTVKDALVKEASILSFINSSQKVKNKSGIPFVMKNESEGFASFDGGKTWYSGTVRTISSSNDGRTQEHRVLRVAAPGYESTISYAKLLYCTAKKMSSIPNGMEIDHLDGYHMHDKLSNYQLVESKQNKARMKVLRLAKELKKSNVIITREELLARAKKLVGSEAKEAVDIVIRYAAPAHGIFIKDSVKDDSSVSAHDLTAINTSCIVGSIRKM